MFLLKKILTALVLPPAGPLLLSALGLLLIRRRPRLGKSLAWGGLVLLWLLATPLLAQALLGLVEAQPPLQPAQMQRAQAIVVLGGESYFAAPEYGGDTVKGHSLERLRYAARLARASGLPVLASGGSPAGIRPEAEAMREALEADFGVRVRWVEGRSRDTVENAAFSAALLREAGLGRVLLVTNALHMRRAKEAFERAGLEVIPAPTAWQSTAPFSALQLLPSADGLRIAYYALREALGLWVQRLSGPA